MARPSSQEVAVLIPLLLSLLTALATIVIHAVALGATVRFIRDCPILDRRCHRGRRYNAGPNRALGGNHNLGDVVLCLRGIHRAWPFFLSFGDELHLARLWRCGDVGFLEIVRTTRSGRRVAHVWRLNRYDLCRNATIVSDETRGKARCSYAPWRQGAG